MNGKLTIEKVKFVVDLVLILLPYRFKVKQTFECQQYPLHQSQLMEVLTWNNIFI